MNDLVSLLRNVDEEAMYAAPFTTKTLINAAANRIEELEKRVAELEARPQPTYALGGAGNYWPWGTMSGLSQTTGAIGTNVSRETPEGPNGPRGPK